MERWVEKNSLMAFEGIVSSSRGRLTEHREISHSSDKQHEVAKLLSQTSLSLEYPEYTLLY
jgi:hypothetical protein